MKQKRTKSILCTLLLPTLLLCTCTTGEEPILPGGRSPMTFTTEVDELIASRATTDNTWDGGEEVAVQIDGVVKNYTADSDGNLADTGSDIIYWKDVTEEHTVMAWYPYSGNQPTNFTVETNQEGSGYQASDCLLSNTITATIRSHALTFKHLPAKVTINLKNGDGVGIEDLADAKVVIVNQAVTSGTVDNDGAVTEVSPESYEIIPNKLAATSNYPQRVQALLVPQQMKDKQFIKVTIGLDDEACDYYYTPTEDDEANLEAGKQYTYNIIVKKTGLQVTVVAWGQDGTTEEDNEITSGFKVVIPDVADVTPKIEGANQTSGMLYTTDGNSFSITLPGVSERNCFIVKGGKCDVEHAVSGDGIKFTYQNIHSNLELVYGKFADLGDYYYADGTWSPDYNTTDTGSPACIGIVFKVGTAVGDAASNYDDKLAEGIHGYVVALTDALTSPKTWGPSMNEDDRYLLNTPFNTDIKYNGYTQTNYIWNNHSDNLYNYNPFKAVKDYTAAPSNSSGWYLPSMKQLSDVRSVYKGEAGSMLYDRLNTIDPNNLFQTEAHYWTSTEFDNNNAWYILFDTSGTIDNKAKSSSCYARAILTF